MKYNKLGQTDMEVSHVCLGTMTWGSEQNTESDGHEQMDYAVEQGINFFDTAELYAIPPREDTQGLTEKYIGTWFAKTGKRKDIVLASKICGGTVHFGIPWIQDGNSITPTKLEKSLEGSLNRLQTDYIDLYQLHWPNYAYPHHGAHAAGAIDYATHNSTQQQEEILEIIRTLDGFVKDGKIRAYGLSNDSAWGTMKYIELANKHNLTRVQSVQNEYSLIYRHDEPYLSEVCAKEDVAYLPYSPLAAGSLSGKYIDGARPEGSRWSLDSRPNQRDTQQAQAAVKAYMNLANKHGLDMCQMALAFCYQQKFITSTIIGATTLDQLKSNVEAKDVILSDEMLQDIHKIYCEYPMPY
jgi:aryl-alcohol dehydrogenase-like predicted oxidoreductase